MDKKEFQVKLLYYGSGGFYKVVSIKGPRPVVRVDMDDTREMRQIRAGDLLDEREASMLGNHAVLTCTVYK